MTRVINTWFFLDQLTKSFYCRYFITTILSDFEKIRMKVRLLKQKQYKLITAAFKISKMLLIMQNLKAADDLLLTSSVYNAGSIL